jgi:cell division transport system permease protein
MSPKAYFSRHAQTLVGSLGRLAKAPIATLMTVSVMGIALSLPLSLYLILQNARTLTANWNQAFDLSVYLDKKIDAARASALAKHLRSRADVADVRVITADQALAEFRDSSGFGTALDALNDNPLPSTLIVTPTLGASTPDGTETLKLAIAKLSDVDTVALDTDWVKRLHALLDILRRVVIITAGLLALGVVLIVGNTIRLDILSRRAEIEVMKLVGASDGFARRPFLYSGLWYGLGGGLTALILSAAGTATLSGPVTRLATLYGSSFRISGVNIGTAATLLGGALVLSWLGSWFAASRHIRAIEPS